jgi:hypothetical protein
MRKIIYKLGLFIFFSFLLIINSSLLIKSQAHPQPLVVQEFLFEYSQKSIVLTYHMRIDPIVMDQVYTDIDKDKDGKITVDETKTFLNDILFKNLTARLNNRDLVFEYDSSLLPKSSDLKSLDNYIGIRLVAKDPKILETNSIYVKYNKKYIPNDAYGDYYNYEDNIIDQNQIERINIDQTEPAGLE